MKFLKKWDTLEDIEDTVSEHVLLRADSMSTNQGSGNKLGYFRSSANTEADKKASRSIMQKINSNFNDV